MYLDFKRVAVITILVVLVGSLYLYCYSFSYASTKTPETLSIEIKHKPVTAIPANRFAEVAVAARDEIGVAEVRFYFKTLKRKWYVFRIMENSGKNRYSAQLPSAKNDSQGIDYLFVIKNKKGEIFKTKPYRVLVQNDYSSITPSTKDEIAVYAEITSPPRLLDDFNLKLTVASAKERMLPSAKQYQHDPITVPGPGSRSSSTGILGGLGGVAASITLGGVGISYRAN